MTEDASRPLGQSREAWARLGEQFAGLAQQFKEHYDKATEAAPPTSAEAAQSFDRAVRSVGQALEGTAAAIRESLHDQKIREGTEEAGTSLLDAVGTTLTEFGAFLRQQAGEERSRTGEQPGERASAEPGEQPGPRPAAQPDGPGRHAAGDPWQQATRDTGS